MKKLIPLFVLLAGASSVLAQGTVSFVNQPLTRRVYQADGTTPVYGTQYRAELLYQNNLGQWVTHQTTADFFGTGTAFTTLRGYWNGGGRTLVNAGGVPSAADPTRANPVQIEIRVWDMTTGSTYDTATLRGTTRPFNYVEEFDSPAGTDDKYMKSFASFTLVPEPSVIGLGVIGIGALFLLRRRK
jgi:hypothetical protein